MFNYGNGYSFLISLLRVAIAMVMDLAKVMVLGGL
jgi:hypothetical protein